MKSTLVILGSLLGIILLVALISGLWAMGTYNKANQIKNTYEAKVSANQASFDNMKGQISQAAEVSDEALTRLQEIFVSYAEARTPQGDDAPLMRWVQESVPNVDTTTMNNLQNIVVSARNQWTSRQLEIVDISRSYNEMLVTFPSNMFLGAFGYEKITPVVITSTNTQRAFQTGIDDAEPLFNRNR